MPTKLYKKEIRPMLEPVYQFGILHETLKLDDDAPNGGWVAADNEEALVNKWRDAYYRHGYDSTYHLVIENRYAYVGEFNI